MFNSCTCLPVTVKKAVMPSLTDFKESVAAVLCPTSLVAARSFRPGSVPAKTRARKFVIKTLDIVIALLPYV